MTGRSMTVHYKCRSCVLSPAGAGSRALRRRRVGHADHAPLVRAHAERSVALRHLDVEAQLAFVDHLAQRRADAATGALADGSDMLDAHLEADGRLPGPEVLEHEHRGV